VDVNLINPFINAARGVFDTMVPLSLITGKPHVRPSSDQGVSRVFKITVVIRFHGSAEGFAVLNISEPVALALAGALSGAPVLKLDDAARDALGEIANLIVGSAKQFLSPDLTISVPQVMNSTEMSYPPQMPVVVIPFDTVAGRFVLEVGLRPGQILPARAAA
jgi:CheY-specific phosphatase CheX